MSQDFETDHIRTRARPPDTSAHETPNRSSILSSVGNSAAGRIFRSLRGTLNRTATGGATLDETVSRAIHAKRGTGQSLDPRAQRDLGAAMGHDFSDVHVHTDTEADDLNHAVRAEAFTTGKDVFFQEGKYDPGSNEGRALLAHELTHVVQQRGSTPTEDLTVSDPGDAAEQQASTVAKDVASPPPQAASGVARQAKPEEDEEQIAPASVDRQAAEDEERAAADNAGNSSPGPTEEDEDQAPAA